MKYYWQVKVGGNKRGAMVSLNELASPTRRLLREGKIGPEPPADPRQPKPKKEG